MSHALIIDDNVALGRAIRNRLEAFGFDSFDYTWGERQALDAAASHVPDLIVVGDTIVEGSPITLVKKLASTNHAPMLIVTADSFMLQRVDCEGLVLEGPHRLSELDDALALVAAGT